MEIGIEFLAVGNGIHHKDKQNSALARDDKNACEPD
jgi:hypothetical protein